MLSSERYTILRRVTATVLIVCNLYVIIFFLVWSRVTYPRTDVHPERYHRNAYACHVYVTRLYAYHMWEISYTYTILNKLPEAVILFVYSFLLLLRIIHIVIVQERYY